MTNIPPPTARLIERFPIFAGLAEVPVIGTLRRCPTGFSTEAASIAVGGGITVIEVTLDSEAPFDQISSIGGSVPGVTVGVGSVLEPSQVSEAVAAGAQFVVAPTTNPEVISASQAHGVPCFPGAATPTEIVAAAVAGAAAVKVFPVDLLGGPAFLSAVQNPLGAPLLVPTGGVTADNARLYLDAGAVAVGAGSALFPRAVLESGDAQALRERTRQWVSAVQ